MTTPVPAAVTVSRKLRLAASTPAGYDVFISYSRGASADLAADLERGLQRLAKRWNQLRAVRVFRDDSAMSASPALWETISEALHESAWLILLATPESAQSEYVNKEINEWLNKKSADQILLVHAGGTIQWDNSLTGRAGNGDFHKSSSAIPLALRSAYTSEPRWVDLEWYSSEGSLKSSDPRFTDRLADLAAPVRGLTKDELIGEDARQHRRTRRLARTAIAALSTLLVLSVAAGIVALTQRSSAIEQRNIASEQSLIARTRLLAATAVDRSATDLQSSLILAATAYRSKQEAQTASALHRVLTTSPELGGFHDFGTPLSIVTGRPGAQTIVAGAESGKVVALDRKVGTRTELFDIGRPVTYLAQSTDGNTVVASGTTADSDADPSEVAASKVWRNGTVEDLPQLATAMSPSGKTIALRPHDGYNESAITVWRESGAVKTIEMKTSFMALPDDNTLIGVNGYGEVQRTSLESEKSQTTRISMGLHMFGGDLSEDGRRFSFIRGGEEIEVWDFGDQLPERFDETATLVATTDSVRTRSIALDPSGNKLATAADGLIYVSEVVKRGEQPQVTVLRGAGENVGALNFIDSNTLLSVSGQTVAVWDLDSKSSLATYVPAVLFGDCNACAPATTLPSPNGEKAIVNPASGFGTVVNFDLGWSAPYSEIRNKDVQKVFDSHPALVWLDDERLFAYSATDGKAWIVEGDFVDQVTAEMSTHSTPAPINKAFLRDDGSIITIADGNTLIIDPSTGASQVGSAFVDSVSADGKYAVALSKTDGQHESTAIKIVSTESEQIVFQGNIDGSVDPQLFLHDRGAFIFARPAANERVASARSTELLRLHPDSSEERVIGMLGPGVRYGSGVALDGYLYAEGSGEILQISLDDASTISVLPILSAPVAPNGLGVSAHGQLVVESESTQQAIRLPVTPDSWIAKSCDLANRPLETRDYESLLTSTDGLLPACGKHPRN